MCWCLEAWRSQTSGIFFSLVSCTEVPSDSLNLLMISCTIDDESDPHNFFLMLRNIILKLLPYLPSQSFTKWWTFSFLLLSDSAPLGGSNLTCCLINLISFWCSFWCVCIFEFLYFSTPLFSLFNLFWNVLPISDLTRACFHKTRTYAYMIIISAPAQDHAVISVSHFHSNALHVTICTSLT